MAHFKLTEKTRQIDDITLYQIELTEDCKWGKKGDKGGWIEKYENLIQNAWVSGDAKVYGNARVSGNAKVYGNARVYGDALVYGDAWEKSPLQITGTKHFLCASRLGYIKIGCQEKTIEEWEVDFKNIGKENRYSENEIEEYGNYINLFKLIYKTK